MSYLGMNQHAHLSSPLEMLDRRSPASTRLKHSSTRFCRVCNEFLPIDMFPRGQRRFTCRPHLWERICKKSRKALLLKPRKRLLASIWTRCYKDARMIGLSLVLKQADIDRILDTIEEQGPNLCIDEVALVPRELSVPMSKENTALVSKPRWASKFQKVSFCFSSLP